MIGSAMIRVHYDHTYVRKITISQYICTQITLTTFSNQLTPIFSLLFQVSMIFEPVSVAIHQGVNFTMPSLMLGAELANNSCSVPNFDFETFYHGWTCPRIMIEVAVSTLCLRIMVEAAVSVLCLRIMVEVAMSTLCLSMMVRVAVSTLCIRIMVLVTVSTLRPRIMVDIATRTLYSK